MHELRQDACEALLARNTFGRLGCYSPSEDQVYVVPISYCFHDGAIFFSSITGEKVEYLRAHPRGICLEVDDVDDGLNWSSVIVRGDFEELQGGDWAAEKPAALRRAEHGPLRYLFDADVPMKARNALIVGRLAIREMSGRLYFCSICARASSSNFPYSTPDGHAVSHALQFRQRSMCVTNVSPSSSRPWSTSDICLIRPRGESASRPHSRYVGQ